MKSLTFLLLLFLAHCAPPRPQPLLPSFYFWETTFKTSLPERVLLDSLNCKTLYIKVLDVGRNASTGEIEPYSRTEFADTLALRGRNMTPTVFITNEVFKNISPEKIDWLAGKIAGVLAEFSAVTTPLCYQFDCDWTPSTRAAFFLFLKKIRDKLPPKTLLSATIRLHQYKFPERTGVPPVDRGMLMFYNTGEIDEEGDKNAIFHPEDALKYLQGAPENYPLPLDLALPLFSWALVYREGELWKIIPGALPLEEMMLNGNYVRLPVDPASFATATWEVIDGTFLGGHYLRPGDHLRVSEVSPALLNEIAGLAQKLDLANDASLVFFQLDSLTACRYSAQLLDSVCKTIRKEQ